jgi:hypothetical protein
MSAPAAVPRRQVFLHIGAMRSGTTFLQQVLLHHREALAADGVLFPGGGRYHRQVAAVRDVIKLPGPLSAAELTGSWAALSAEIAAWGGGRSIVSVEHLSLARPAQVAAVTESLAPAEVHVVLTARDLGRVLPSSWQETVQNGSTRTWPEYVSAVLGEPRRDGAGSGAGDGVAEHRFWRQHDLLQIVRRWSTAVPAEQIHVVTVPPPGSPPDVLWQRLCDPVGIDADRYPVGDVASVSNRGLGRYAVEMLRELNLRLEDRLQPAEYVRCVKRPVAKHALGRLPSAPIRVPAEHAAHVVDRSNLVVAGLRKRGVRVVGNLQDLIPPMAAHPGDPAAVPASAARRSRVDAEQIAAAATASAATLLRALADAHAPTVPGTDHAS